MLRALGNQVFTVCQDDETGDNRLTNLAPVAGPEAYRLWKVTLANDSVHFVLAVTEDGAISQATCEREIDMEEQRKLARGAFAVLIPFKIRGWSYHQF